MINAKRFYLFTLGLLLALNQPAISQSTLADYSESQIRAYENRVEDQVRFLEYLLNTLGSKNTNQRDKEVIIKESYQKIFLSAEVQIEDDLNESRKVITNKDVTAYLKDVDFFFKDIQFNFEIQEIEALEKPNGGIFFRITINRTLKGTDIDGRTVLNTKKRYVETNLNETTDELQIASIYTTKLSKEKALQEWWGQLSYGWKSIFKQLINSTADSISINDLYKIAALDSLNLANNTFIQDVEPLSILTDLVYLNLKNSTVKDIHALSSLTNLKVLNLSGTIISDLQYIRYAENIELLAIDQTQITDLSPIQHFAHLKSLSLAGTPVNNFEAISNLKAIEYLNVSDTRFADTDSELILALNKLKELNASKTTLTNLDSLIPPQLEDLDVTFTVVSKLQPLIKHNSLRVIKISNTQVRSIKELLELPKLERVYADNLFLDQVVLNNFKNERPKVLLVVDSEELTAWWASLDFAWKKELAKYLGKENVNTPSKEALSKLITIDSLSISNAGLNQLFPLKKFNRLVYLDLSSNQIASLGPISEATSLTYLNLAHNKITSIKPLSNLRKLKKLDLSSNQFKSEELIYLARLQLLQELNLNELGFTKKEIIPFVEANENNCLVNFAAQEVLNWWTNLSNTWRQVFYVQQSMDQQPNVWQLTALLQKQSIVIAEETLTDLDPLKQFVLVKSLYMEKLLIDDFSAIASLNRLENLSMNKMPLNDLGFLENNVQLINLNFDFTAVDDLRYLENLQELKTLSLVGAALSKLKGIESLKELELLNIASTQVRWIGKLDDLPHLQKLVCYNTKIWERSIDKYKKDNPDCEVVWY